MICVFFEKIVGNFKSLFGHRMTFGPANKVLVFTTSAKWVQKMFVLIVFLSSRNFIVK